MYFLFAGAESVPCLELNLSRLPHVPFLACILTPLHFSCVCFQDHHTPDSGSELHQPEESSDQVREAGSQRAGVLCPCSAPSQGV